MLKKPELTGVTYWVFFPRLYLRHCIGVESSCREVLQFLPAYGTDEVEVVRAVEPVLKIFRNALQVLIGRLAEVNGGNIRNRIPTETKE